MSITTFDDRVHALCYKYVQKLARCFTVPKPFAGFRDWMVVLHDLRQAWREVTDDLNDKVLTVLEDWLGDL
jgi:hypothetical protein